MIPWDVQNSTTVLIHCLENQIALCMSAMCKMTRYIIQVKRGFS